VYGWWRRLDPWHVQHLAPAGGAQVENRQKGEFLAQFAGGKGAWADQHFVAHWQVAAWSNATTTGQTNEIANFLAPI
jgi:hypothetical protein